MSIPPVPPTPPAPPITPTPAAVLPEPRPPRRSETSIPLAWSVAGATLVAAVINGGNALGFPSNAPVESIYAFGITVDLLVIALVLCIRAVRHSKLLRAEPRPPKVSRTAIAAAVLSLIALWAAVYSGVEFFGDLFGGERARYMTGGGGAFFYGAPWVLGVIFGVAAYRRGGGTLNTVLSIGAIVCGAIMTIVALGASFVYGAGLSD